MAVFLLAGAYLVVMRGGCGHPLADQETLPPPAAAYDVIVVGAEPGGVVAAVSAARAGARTLLIDRREAIGGLWTLAKMNTLDVVLLRNNTTGQKSLAQRGILRDILNKLGINYLGWERYFDVPQMQRVLNKLTEDEPNLTLMLDTRVSSALATPGQPRPIKAIVVFRPHGSPKTLTARVFIDGTDNADLVGLLGRNGEDYFIGRWDFTGKEEMMGATLMLEVKGTKGLRGLYREATDEMNSLLFANEERVSIGRGMNIGWQKDGSVLVSSMKIYGVNGLDGKSVQEGLKIGKEYAPQIVAFLNGSLTGKPTKGWENARLVSTPDHLYIRETRHIISLHRITFWDIINGATPADTVALGTYPIDLQPYLKTENPYSYSVRVAGFPWQEIGKNGLKHRLYGIPLRSLVPKNIDDLLVVGRPISADSIAAGSIRVMSHAVAMGEAAGAAAAQCASQGISVHQMANDPAAIERLRTYLVNDRGLLLDPKGFEPE